MTKTNKKLIVAILVALATATAAGAGIHLIAGEGSNTVGKDSAKEIALAHAGFSEAEVTLQKVALDRDDGRNEYEIEFRKDGVKYEYEIDARSGEIISYDKDGKKASVTDADGSPATVTAITAEEAKTAALAHAGLNASEVSFTKVKLDRDDGRNEYEIEFRKDNVKYEYEIDAESGEILSYDRETKKTTTTKPVSNTTVTEATPTLAEPTAPSEPDAPAADVPSEEQIVTTPVISAAPAPEVPVTVEQITDAEAKAIALAHAGLVEAEVTFTKVKLDRDDGRNEYEVEFRKGNVKYDYDIDAKSGEILSYDREEKAVATQKPVASVDAPATADKISAEEAKKLSLAHAGLTEADVTFTKVKLEYDDGRSEYELEFRQGRIEYEYEIDAESGQILDFEKDIDD